MPHLNPSSIGIEVGTQPLSRQTLHIHTQHSSQRVHHHPMVDALVQPAGDHAPNHPSPPQGDRKSAPVQRVVRKRKPMTLLDRFTLKLQLQPHRVGALAEPHHYVPLAANPIRLACRRAFSRRIKQRTTSYLDLERHRRATSDGIGAKPAANGPCDVRSKGGKL